MHSGIVMIEGMHFEHTIGASIIVPITLIYSDHVAVGSNLYFSYTSVLMHCIDAVLTKVLCRPCIVVNPCDPHGLHTTFVNTASMQCINTLA